MGSSLSIVIPSRNSGRTIDACLRSVLSDTTSDTSDVIVVDNGSSDDTLEIVRRYPVRLEVIPPGFVSTSRNVGARLAKHPLVAFIDSDCAVRSGWRTAVVDTLADPAVGIIGRRHDPPDNGTWVQQAWDRAHARAHATHSVREVPYVPAGNMAARTAVFLGVNGFDDTLETGEDPDLCARVAAQGLRIVEVPGMRCIHFGEPATLGAVFRRERWHGRGTRLRYGDGRLAPIMLTTLAFGAAVLLSLLGGLVALSGGGWWLLAGGLALLAGVPAIYAARYAKSLAHAVPLLLIYIAYFFGRAAALGVVLRRASEHSKEPAALPGHGRAAERADDRGGR
jgi:GT2 family glycosyltransferase